MAETQGDGLHVELVSADRTVWSGEAGMVIARTTEGDIGVLRGHAPMLSLLSQAVVEIQVSGTNDVVIAAVSGGFISVANDRVSVLSEQVELGEEIHVGQVQAELEEAQAHVLDSNNESEQRVRFAEARLRASERVS